MKLLILGASGLLGNTLTKYFLKKSNYQTFGTIRDKLQVEFFNETYHKKFTILNDILNFAELENIIDNLRPDVVINSIGLNNKIKKNDFSTLEKYILINSLFPHKLQSICSRFGIRLIQLSSDCVFSGIRGNYSEKDLPDPLDIYGKTKLMGELESDNCLTIRKSAIGHELITKDGLLDWFLSRNDKVEGYKKAIFSGLTVLELARIIDIFILPRKELKGILHIAGFPISKYDLLNMISSEYKKSIELIPNDSFKINRSLDSTYFTRITGYQIQPWPLLIKSMHEFKLLNQ